MSSSLPIDDNVLAQLHSAALNARARAHAPYSRYAVGAALLVSGPGPETITPCGGCRQKLREFGDESLVVIAADATGIQRSWTLGELLPSSFGPDHLSPSLSQHSTTHV